MNEKRRKKLHGIQRNDIRAIVEYVREFKHLNATEWRILWRLQDRIPANQFVRYVEGLTP